MDSVGPRFCFLVRLLIVLALVKTCLPKTLSYQNGKRSSIKVLNSLSEVGVAKNIMSNGLT